MNGSLALRLPVAVLCLAGGAVIGTASALLHGYVWGLALGVVTTAALLVALPGGWWLRLSFALGWCLTVMGLSFKRPEGDLLVAADVRGYLLLGAGVAVLMGGVVGLVDHRAPEGDVAESDVPLS